MFNFVYGVFFTIDILVWVICGVFFGGLFLGIIIGLIKGILFNIKKFSKYKFISSPKEILDLDTPYVLSGKIYSYEENLISPASQIPCIYYSYQTRAYKGNHSTKLYLVSQDGLKIELHSSYFVQEFQFQKYNYQKFPDYYVNLNSYLQKSDFKMAKFFSNIPQKQLKEQVEKDEKYKEENKDSIDRLKNTNTSSNVPILLKGFYKTYKKIVNEELYVKEYNKDLDNDQFLLTGEGSQYDYLSNKQFLNDEINELYIVPGQEVTVVCYRDRENNYVVGNFKFFELIKIFPGIGFDPRKALFKENKEKLLVLAALIGLFSIIIYAFVFLK